MFHFMTLIKVRQTQHDLTQYLFWVKCMQITDMDSQWCSGTAELFMSRSEVPKPGSPDMGLLDGNGTADFNYLVITLEWIENICLHHQKV